MLFPQLYGKCQGITRQDEARPALFQIFVLFYILFVLCRSVYCLCVNVYCTTATGVNPTAVNRYIISYHIISYHKLALKMTGRRKFQTGSIWCKRKLQNGI